MSLWNFALEYSKNKANVVPYHDDLNLSDSVARFPSASDGVTAPIIKALFSSKDLLADNFAQRSRAETFGGHFIAQVVPLCRDDELKKDLTAHSDDEYRHGRMFDALVWRVTHGTEPPPQSEEIAKLREAEIEEFSGDPKAFVVSTHVAELKSLYELGEYLRCAGGLSPELGKKVASVLSSILGDEVRHASYSGQWALHFLREESIPNDYLADCFRSYEVDAWKQVAANCARLAKHIGRSSQEEIGGSRNTDQFSDEGPQAHSSGSFFAAEARSFLTVDSPAYPEAYFDFLAALERRIPSYLEEAVCNTLSCIRESQATLKRVIDYLKKPESEIGARNSVAEPASKAISSLHSQHLGRFIISSRLVATLSEAGNATGDLVESANELRRRSARDLARSAGFLSGKIEVERDGALDPTICANRMEAFLWNDVGKIARLVSRSF